MGRSLVVQSGGRVVAQSCRGTCGVSGLVGMINWRESKTGCCCAGVLHKSVFANPREARQENYHRKPPQRPLAVRLESPLGGR